MADPEEAPINTPPAPKQPAKAPQGAAAGKESQVPPGFKIVKVRKPDGTIARFKRPIGPTQTPAEERPAESNAGAATNGTTAAAATSAKDEANPSSEKPATTTTTPETTTTSTSATKTTPSQKSTSTAPQAAAAATPEQPRQRSSGRFFSAFAIRAATAMIPGIEVFEEPMDGDEPLDDGNDSDDFDDDDDNGSHDGHDDNNDNQHGAENGGHQQIGNNIAMAGATGLAAGSSAQQQQPPAYARTQNGTAQNQAKSGVKVSEKAQPQVNEKDIGDDVKPGDPETRGLHKSFPDWTRYIIWFIMISFPILYIVLGILTAILPYKEYNGQYGQALAQATKVAVSAWPIIFAAIAAQSLRTIASYKVERGIRLMTLEQLMGSNSVASSIKQPFLLRRFDIVTIALLILWSLSPFATQALQRMSFNTERDTPSSTTVWYLDTWTYNVAFNDQYSPYLNEGNVLSYGNIIRQFFEASTIPPAQDQAAYQDPWGRPKIPIIKLLDNSKADSEGWIGTGIGNFSSNYGIPLGQPQLKDADYNFNISSSYLDFSCSPLAKLHSAQFNQTDNLTIGVDVPNVGTYTTYIKIIPQNETSSGQVIYASYVNTDGSTEVDNPDQQEVYAYSTCNFTQTFVDSQVSCYISQASTSDTSSPDYIPGNSDCLVLAVRPTKPQPSNTPMGDFTGAFVDTAGSVLYSYLYNPSNVVGLFSNVSASIMDVSDEDFTLRLSTLINTYWQLGFGPTVQDSGLNYETADMYNYTVKNVTADVTTSQTVYAVSWGWIAVLIICSGILLVAGMASMIMDSRTVEPDMLWFASSLARKSKYLNLPKVDGTESGAERARSVGEHMVMMQDVKPDAPVGRVVLGSANPAAKRLEKGRPYRRF